MDRTLALDKSDHLRDRIFWWNRNHHVNVIQHKMAFFDSAFLLQRQLAEDIAKMRSQLPVQGLSPALGNEHNVIFALPLAVAVILVHREASFRVLGGSRSEASSMDDCRKRQTSTATPAEPGDLPWGLAAKALPDKPAIEIACYVAFMLHGVADSKW